jgi:hypothetical protein
VERFVEYYNTKRLHSALSYVTRKERLEGRTEAIQAERESKLTETRACSARNRAAKDLTLDKETRRLNAIW